MWRFPVVVVVAVVAVMVVVVPVVWAFTIVATAQACPLCCFRWAWWQVDRCGRICRHCDYHGCMLTKMCQQLHT